jgi:hypothetical protein
VPALRRLFETEWQRLVELNQAGLDFLREAYGIGTPLVRSSELAVEGARGELIFSICRAVGADRLLAGQGGSRAYLDVAAFARRGVQVQFHEFRHPQYRQCGAAPFLAGLSALDMLFNCGPASRELLLGAAPATLSRAAA